MSLENMLCVMKFTHSKYFLVFDRRKRWPRRENGNKGWCKDTNKEIKEKRHKPKGKKGKKDEENVLSNH